MTVHWLGSIDSLDNVTEPLRSDDTKLKTGPYKLGENVYNYTPLVV